MSNPYLTRAYVIAAGDHVNVIVTGNYFRMLSTTGAVLVGVPGEERTSLEVGIGVPVPGGFDRVIIENAGAGAVSCEIAIGQGAIADNRLNVSGVVVTSETLPATQTPGSDIAILTGTAGTIAALAGRRECLMQADGALRLSGVTGKGFIWDGSPMFLTSAGAIDFFNDTASTVTVTYTELST